MNPRLSVLLLVAATLLVCSSLAQEDEEDTHIHPCDPSPILTHCLNTSAEVIPENPTMDSCWNIVAQAQKPRELRRVQLKHLDDPDFIKAFEALGTSASTSCENAKLFIEEYADPKYLTQTLKLLYDCMNCK